MLQVVETFCSACLSFLLLHVRAIIARAPSRDATFGLGRRLTVTDHGEEIEARDLVLDLGSSFWRRACIESAKLNRAHFDRQIFLSLFQSDKRARAQIVVKF